MTIGDKTFLKVTSGSKDIYTFRYGCKDDNKSIDFLSFLRKNHNDFVETLCSQIKFTDRYCKSLVVILTEIP